MNWNSRLLAHRCALLLTSWRQPSVTFSRLGAMGQFGNQLFQIAAVLGYAAHHGNRALLPPWHCEFSHRNYETMFPWFAEYRGWNPGHVIQQTTFEYHDLPAMRHADLRGFFQSERYFHHIQDRIRTLFSEPRNIGLALDAYCADHGLGDFDALHVRFYSHAFDLGGPLELLPTSYFTAAAAMLGKDRPLVVATDDKPAFLRMTNEFGLRRDLHLLRFEDSLLDFYMLSRARGIAISNSSFGWWAAYLGAAKELVIAPDRRFWFSAKMRDDPRLDTRDLYPAHFNEFVLS